MPIYEFIPDYKSNKTESRLSHCNSIVICPSLRWDRSNV